MYSGYVFLTKLAEEFGVKRMAVTYMLRKAKRLNPKKFPSDPKRLGPYKSAAITENQAEIIREMHKIDKRIRN